MKSLNEQTIKRLQKLAGINEIKVKLPHDNQLPFSLQNFLDEEFDKSTELRNGYTQIIKILIGWTPFNDLSVGYDDVYKDGYMYHEDSFDNYKVDDPNAKRFIEVVKGPKYMYLGNWAPYLTSKGHSIKIIFNDPKPGNFNVSMADFSYDPDDPDKFTGYFDNNGTFVPEPE
jgi:hypothetical protein